VPVSYQLEPVRRLVRSRAWGVLTDREIEAHYTRLVHDPGFESSFRQLCDMTEVTRIDATAEMLRRLAQQAIFSPGTQRAFVAVQDAHYGLTRMFQVFCELEGTRVEIFRDTADADAWLDPAPAAARSPARHFGDESP
jgi:hypothetical protein